MHFVVTFHSDNDLLHVVVNRDPEQYRSTDVHEDEYELNRLLNWWIHPDYDPYDVEYGPSAQEMVETELKK